MHIGATVCGLVFDMVDRQSMFRQEVDDIVWIQDLQVVFDVPKRPGAGVIAELDVTNQLVYSCDSDLHPPPRQSRLIQNPQDSRYRRNIDPVSHVYSQIAANLFRDWPTKPVKPL